MTNPRDYAAEFIAACQARRSATATFAEQGEARKAATKIERAARKAGVDLDVIALDEQARVNLYG